MAGPRSRFSKTDIQFKAFNRDWKQDHDRDCVNNLTPDRQHNLFLFAKFNMNVNLIFHLY